MFPMIQNEIDNICVFGCQKPLHINSHEVESIYLMISFGVCQILYLVFLVHGIESVLSLMVFNILLFRVIIH